MSINSNPNTSIIPTQINPISQIKNNNIKKQKRKILTEEEYTTTLSTIIQRDYYPSIPSLHRDASVLQKRSENDTAGAISIRKAARKLELQEEECKLREDEEDYKALLYHGGIRDRARPLERESIDGFHKRVTSEDNSYFDENMRKEVREHKEKMDIIYQSNIGNPKGHVMKLLENYNEHGRKDDSSLVMLKNNKESFTSASDQFNPPVERIQTAGTTKDGKSKSIRNSLFFTPQHYNPSTSALPMNDCCSSESKAIIPLLENTNITDDNQIMPPPPPRQNLPLTQNQPKPPNPNFHLVEYQAKPQNREFIIPSSSSSLSSYEYNISNEKQIVPGNTRFEYQNKSRIIPSLSTTSTSSIQQQQHHSKQVYDTDSSYTSTDLDAPVRPLHIERKARLNQLQKERNTLVAMTPTIIPGVKLNHYKNNDSDDYDDDEDDENGSPIVTWGEIASTPLVASGEKLNQYTQHDTSSSSNDNGEIYEKIFQLPSIDVREHNAIKAEEIITRQKQRFDEASGSKHHSSISRNNNNNSNNSTNGIIMKNSANNNKNTSSSSSSLLERKKSLTPAARSLLDRSIPRSSNNFIGASSKLSTKVNARCNSALGSALRSSYTPKRIKLESISRSNSNMSRSKDPSSVYKSTPLSSRKQDGDIKIQMNSSKGHDKGTSNSTSLTSGLLKF